MAKVPAQQPMKRKKKRTFSAEFKARLAPVVSRNSNDARAIEGERVAPL